MDVFVPTLETKMVALVAAFRFIVYAIMVAGLVFAMASQRTRGGPGLFVPLVKAILIIAAVAYMDQWFPKVEQVFMDVANFIDPGYKNNPTSSADAIRDSTTQNPQGASWSWRQINESIYQAVTRAIANIFIYIGTLITVPMLILQYVLRWLLYLLTPFALAMFMVPGFSGLGVRFFQQLLAILAWPIGFALTNLVALAVWTDFRSAVGANPNTLGNALYSPMLTFMGGILATIMIVVGMVSTPIVMQMLFAQGNAFTGASGNPAHMVRGASSSIYGVGDRFLSRQMPLAPVQPAASPPAPPSPMGTGMRPGI